MKNKACTILLLMAAIVGHAQTPSWDSSYRPPSYTQRLALFKSYKHSTKDVVFPGNSITAGINWNEGICRLERSA